MLGTFTYSNPTILHFGKEALRSLRGELDKYGDRVLLVYGGGSIKQNGIYDDVMAILNTANKTVFELSGILSNPTTDMLNNGIAMARKYHIDFILAIGGGSVIDFSKGLSASIHLSSDPWKTYYLHQENVSNDTKIVPMGAILTMVGTASEMNGGSVITHEPTKMKIGKVFDTRVYPKFAIINPEWSFTVSSYQMVAGIFDIMSHLMEQYFSNDDNNTSDYIIEGLMRCVIDNARVAVKNPTDYEARSNIAWASTWSLNTLTSRGKSGDWMVHMIGQSIGGVTNHTHGMTLSAISLAYYHYIYKEGLPKFVRFAKNVWQIDTTNLTNEAIALEGLNALKTWMCDIGVVLSLSELGVNKEQFDDIVKGTILLSNGYKTLNKQDVYNILENSL